MKGFLIAIVIAILLIVVAFIGARPSGSMKDKVVGVWKMAEFLDKPATHMRYIELQPDSMYDSDRGEFKVTYDDKATIAIVKRADNGEEILRANIMNDGRLSARLPNPLSRDLPLHAVFVKTTKEDMEKAKSKTFFR